jgi:hypothetical protein
MRQGDKLSLGRCGWQDVLEAFKSVEPLGDDAELAPAHLPLFVRRVETTMTKR